MDHYIPKRRVSVTLWSRDLQGVVGSVFLDLDASGARHQTILEKLNESSPFLAVAVGAEGRIHLTDGLTLQGKVWMPLQRESQRLSDFMNQQVAGFFVVLTSVGPHLVHPSGVIGLRLSESAGASVTSLGEEPFQDGAERVA